MNLDDEYTRQRATLGVSRPLRQDSKLTLIANGTFEADDLIIDEDGATVREDRLRIIDAGLRASWSGASATQYSANLRMRKGLDAFGAGLQATDLLVDPRRADFLITLLQGSTSRRFAEHWSARFDGFSQYTRHVLPDTERFKIGGDRLGRGFEVAEIAGDSGLGAKVELRRDLKYTESFIGRVSAYGFYDFGAAWKNDQPGRESAATAGTALQSPEARSRDISKSPRRSPARTSKANTRLPCSPNSAIASRFASGRAPNPCARRVDIVTSASYNVPLQTTTIGDRQWPTPA